MVPPVARTFTSYPVTSGSGSFQRWVQLNHSWCSLIDHFARLTTLSLTDVLPKAAWKLHHDNINWSHCKNEAQMLKGFSHMVEMLLVFLILVCVCGSNSEKTNRNRKFGMRLYHHRKNSIFLCIARVPMIVDSVRCSKLWLSLCTCSMCTCPPMVWVHV